MPHVNYGLRFPVSDCSERFLFIGLYKRKQASSIFSYLEIPDRTIP